jgi:hypothetical protein
MSTSEPVLPVNVASEFARSTLGNVVREYPNKLDQVLNGPEDLRSPRALHPIFFGCFDWHSCVHGYWQLAKLRRVVEGLPQRGLIEDQFDLAFTDGNVGQEISYFHRPGGRGFERPYGWAWLLKLCEELSRHDDDRGRRWHRTLLPLAELIADRFLEFLPKAAHPIRAGTHGNTAFALVHSLDFASSHQHQQLLEILGAKARQWYLGDANWTTPEPSQTDFLSPMMTEALCMSRVLCVGEFHEWFGRFMPELEQGKPAALFVPAEVSDRTDGQIAHLDGLNLSRAWCFRSIARLFPVDSDKSKILVAAAERHLAASLPHLFDDYAGEHWLASFALLALG